MALKLKAKDLLTCRFRTFINRIQRQAIINYKERIIKNEIQSTTVSQTYCLICQSDICIDNKKPPKIKCNFIHPDVRLTRNMTKLLDRLSDFIILEAYRCMPLLGNEEEVPNWDVHIVHYVLVFKNLT